MKVSYEIDLKDFDAWSGARDTLNSLTDEQIVYLDEYICEAFMYEEGSSVDETQLNDFLWFEKDQIADICGFKNWEDLLKWNESHNP